MNADRPYWDMDIEPLFNTPDMAKIQMDKLKTILGRLKANAPFYTRQFEEFGLDPERISSFDEYKEKVPLFDKAALRELVAECGNDILKALDHIMPVSVSDLDYIATTTGTTGVPTPYPLTLNDIHNVWGEVLSRGAWRAGIRSNDSILYCFALSMVIAGVPSMMGIQKMGATMLPVGAEAKSERILLMQNLFGGTVYMGTPSLAEYLIPTAKDVPEVQSIMIESGGGVGPFGAKGIGEPATVPAAPAPAPPARAMATGSVGAELRLWNANSYRPERVIPGHAKEITAVAFDPMSKVIA